MKKLTIFSTIIVWVFLFCSVIYAEEEENAKNSEIQDLRSKIEERNLEIESLEKEIAELQKQLFDVSKETDTLQNALKILDITRQKLNTDIAITQKKIDALTLTIKSLGGEINNKESKITAQILALGDSIRELQELDDHSLAEVMLATKDLSDFFDNKEGINKLQKAIGEHLSMLRRLKKELGENKTEAENKQRDLARFKNQLLDQKKIIDQNKKEKDTLLKQTKNKESEYKKIIAEKERIKSAFEEELLSIESELRLIIDPSSIPKAGKGVLSWPVDNPMITQEFGDTAFSRAHTSLYNGRGHNGIDLRASPGTPIKAALSGVVVGAGDTDTVCRGASYGKWVLIKHANGLSTLYAHLSLIKVGVGQNVATREIIGYSGTTGYATGPHLHFTLYASEGVQIASRKSKVCGGTYTMPIADLKAYLNPLLYL